MYLAIPLRHCQLSGFVGYVLYGKLFLKLHVEVDVVVYELHESFWYKKSSNREISDTYAKFLHVHVLYMY